MARAKRKYITTDAAIKLGYPDLRGTKRGNQRFTKYVQNEKTGHCEPKYMASKTLGAIKNRSLKKKLKFMQRYKLFVGCAFCGYKKHPTALDFDHINPNEKLGTISKAYKGWGWKRLKDEIRKCQVLCANCHRIKTIEQKDNKRGRRDGLRKEE